MQYQKTSCQFWQEPRKYRKIILRALKLLSFFSQQISKSLIGQFDIGADKTRVALLIYSSDASVEFTLDRQVHLSHCKISNWFVMINLVNTLWEEKDLELPGFQWTESTMGRNCIK